MAGSCFYNWLKERKMMRRLSMLIVLLITLFSHGVLTDACAGVVYTDIDPDNSFTTGGGFDFNGDATAEITTNNGVYLTVGVHNIWANGNASSGWDVPKPLQANTTIDAGGNFIGAGDASMNAWGAGTPFPQNQDAYMGIKIVLSGNTMYGWVRVFWNGTDFVYKDYAYETTPGAAINAGDSGTQALESGTWAAVKTSL